MGLRSRVAAVVAVVGSTFLFGGCPADGPIEFTIETIFLRPTADIVGTPDELGFDFDSRRLPLNEEREIAIWHVRADTDEPRGIVVIIPGSDRNKSRYLIGLPVFVPNGYDVVLVDYEGFGESTDAPLELERLTANGMIAVDYALEQDLPVIVFGISTGGPTAAYAAAKRDVAAVLLEAPLLLDRIPSHWLQENLGQVPVVNVVLPAAWFVAELWIAPQVPDSFNTLKYIAEVDEPKLVMQSVEDDVVPYRSGKQVFNAAAKPKELFEMTGGHGKMIELEPELYEATIMAWLDKVLE